MCGEEALILADHDGDDLTVELGRRAAQGGRRVGGCRFVQGLAPVEDEALAMKS